MKGVDEPDISRTPPRRGTAGLTPLNVQRQIVHRLATGRFTFAHNPRGAMTPIELLTLGLLVFAGVQVAVHVWTAVAGKRERRADLEDLQDRAFQYAWAEHFRLASLADVMRRSDLIEMALLDLIRPEDVQPADSVHLMEALAISGSESGVLAGFLAGATVDVQRSLGILIRSTQSFAKQAPAGMPDAERVKWVRQHYGKDLRPWEDSTRRLVEELANLAWDAIEHSPRSKVDRTFDFSESLTSEFSKAAVKSLADRMSNPAAASTKGSRAAFNKR
jgi:hypothetical protein